VNKHIFFDLHDGGCIAILLFGSGCSAIKAYWEWSSYWMSVSEDRIYPKRPKLLSIQDMLMDFQRLSYQLFITVIRVIPTSLAIFRFVTISFDFGVWTLLWTLYKRAYSTLEDVESFKQACLGFYEINENEFSMDLYFPDYYQRVWGQIDHEKIVISNAEQRYNGPIYKMQDNIVYFRLPLARMQRQPDWSPTGMLHQAFSGARTANTTDDPKTSD
jgi:hypothetical protein